MCMSVTCLEANQRQGTIMHAGATMDEAQITSIGQRADDLDIAVRLFPHFCTSFEDPHARKRNTVMICATTTILSLRNSGLIPHHFLPSGFYTLELKLC